MRWAVTASSLSSVPKRRRYRNSLLGLGVVCTLVAVIVALSLWQVNARRLHERDVVQALGAGGTVWTPLGSPPAGDQPVTGAPDQGTAPRGAGAPAPAPASPPVVDSGPPRSAGLTREAASAREARATPGSSPSPTASPAARVSAPSSARFAVEFGPFPAARDAERIETQLRDAGHLTVRFRQETGGRLYAILVKRLPGVSEGALVAGLRREGVEGAAVGGDGSAVRAGDPLPVHAAVQLAERLRAQGHHVRIAAHPGKAEAFIVRHGNFASWEDAEGAAADLAARGLAGRVVRARARSAPPAVPGVAPASP